MRRFQPGRLDIFYPQLCPNFRVFQQARATTVTEKLGVRPRAIRAVNAELD